jgi:hypothetical protein
MSNQTTTAPSRDGGTNLFEKIRGFSAQHIGFVITCLFLSSLPVAMRLAGIPLRFAASNFLNRYIAVAIQSIAYALLLAALGFPSETLAPVKERYVASPARGVIVVLLGVLFFYLYPAWIATVFLLIAIAILEAYERSIPLMTLAKPLLPGLYLFLGLVTVFGYNAVAVTLRFYPNYDHVLKTVDSYLLLGHSVSGLAHQFCAAAPRFVVTALMVSYMALFAQIGAGLLLTSLKVGRDEGMRFVSTILLAYLFSMIIFVIFPTHSPYFTCTDHASSALPTSVLEAQQALMALADSRWHKVPLSIDTEYYIAFPCMHIAQPLIVLWFLRKWRRMVFALVVVDTILTAAIMLLEWHYVADLIGGVLVSLAAIGIVTWRSKSGSAVAGEVE